VTFATNRDAGPYIRFAEPVPAIDPPEKILHPGVTVTGEQVEDLQRQLTPLRAPKPMRTPKVFPPSREELWHVGGRGGPRTMLTLQSHGVQLYRWVHVCCRVAEMAKGTVAGKPQVRTVRYES
jgi:hypothetical protein